MFISKKKIFVILSLLIAVTLILVTMNPAGMATAKVLPKAQAATTLNAPVVNPDGTVTFTLRAPGANQVYLNFQNMVGGSPRYNSYAMTEGADGVWSITMGPTVPGLMGWANPPAPLDPNWYGYGFNIDGTPPVVPPPDPAFNATAIAGGGVNIADPANRDIWSGATSAWSYVMVPGSGTEFMADAAVPHGAVATVRYFSKVTQKERQMQVYTPPGYNHDNRRYPVLYVMHGGGGNDTDWIVNMRANFILDNLIAQGKAVPMILVSPNANADGFPSSAFPDELLDNIVPYIEENYRTAPGGNNRALAGLSMGGFRTTETVFSHPGVFAYVGVFSSSFRPSTAFPADLLANPDLNKLTKLLWITRGSLEGPGTSFLELLDLYGVNYTNVPGSDIGANGGHIWGTWRHALWAFAPLLFKK
jgi:enterochelin esterase-like enzyme